MINKNNGAETSIFRKSRSGYRYLLSAGSLFLLFSLSFGVTGAEDDYLQALEAEANGIQLDSTNSKPSKPEVQTNTKSETESQKISSNQRLQFENSLKARLPRSFSTYLTLTNQNKIEVIHTYFSNSKQMHLAIRKLYKLHFNKK
ncbi:MAG: hypothetical protein KAU21_15480 [Gammaproteobacteria bacterium]|nr:hypothetical protein [Gammaproteobacteria bacterium]